MPTEKELKEKIDQTTMRHSILAHRLADLRRQPTRKNIKERRALDEEIGRLHTLTGIYQRELAGLKKKGGRRTRKNRRHH